MNPHFYASGGSRPGEGRSKRKKARFPRLPTTKRLGRSRRDARGPLEAPVARVAMSVPTGRAEEETGPAVVLAAVDRAAVAGKVGLGREHDAPGAPKSNGEVPHGPQNSKVLRYLERATTKSPGPAARHRDL